MEILVVVSANVPEPPVFNVYPQLGFPVQPLTVRVAALSGHTKRGLLPAMTGGSVVLIIAFTAIRGFGQLAVPPVHST